MPPRRAATVCRPIAPCLHARAAASARRFYSASSASDQLFASACSVTSCARSDARSSVAAMGRTGEDAAAATRRVTFALSYSTQAVATAAVEAATGVVEASCCGMRLLLLKCCGRSSSASRGSRLFRTRLLCASAALVPLWLELRSECSPRRSSATASPYPQLSSVRRVTWSQAAARLCIIVFSRGELCRMRRR